MRIICFVIAGLLISSCTHRIVRIGYDVTESEYKNCAIVIKKDTCFSDTSTKKLGEIKLGESGFSVACSEEHAINILKKEACAIHADLVVITEERRPDVLSSCYRCRAVFYKYDSLANGNRHLQSDEGYKAEEIKDRVNEDRNKNAAMAVIAAISGLVLGFLLF